MHVREQIKKTLLQKEKREAKIMTLQTYRTAKKKKKTQLSVRAGKTKTQDEEQAMTTFNNKHVNISSSHRLCAAQYNALLLCERAGNTARMNARPKLHQHRRQNVNNLA